MDSFRPSGSRGSGRVTRDSLDLILHFAVRYDHLTIPLYEMPIIGPNGVERNRTNHGTRLPAATAALLLGVLSLHGQVTSSLITTISPEAVKI